MSYRISRRDLFAAAALANFPASERLHKKGIGVAEHCLNEADNLIELLDSTRNPNQYEVDLDFLIESQAKLLSGAKKALKDGTMIDLIEAVQFAEDGR